MQWLSFIQPTVFNFIVLQATQLLLFLFFCCNIQKCLLVIVQVHHLFNFQSFLVNFVSVCTELTSLLRKSVICVSN